VKKIKVFLGGYINSSNAQNINCRSIANHLDKKQFDVFALELYSGNLLSLPKNIVKTFTCSYPHRVSQYIGFLWGVYQCDIAFLPKSECHKWNKFWVKCLRKKCFSTIEGILDDIALNNAVLRAGNKRNVIGRYNNFEHLYSITQYMRNYNFNNLGIKSLEKILYLGTETETFINTSKKNNMLKNIILIGNDLVRKGIFDYLKLAEKYPDLSFHVVGTGNGKIELNHEITKNNLNNVIYHGGKTHEDLIEILKSIDLHILPSHSEGFPKVTLETAAAGIPSLVYSDYGASEWIEDHNNGFVVDSLDKMQLVIDEILVTPELLTRTSINAIDLAKRFDWKYLIKDWEKEILIIMEDKC
jgi:glycosyltransferase involved in cell wall biosynthesis